MLLYNCEKTNEILTSKALRYSHLNDIKNDSVIDVNILELIKSVSH